MIFGYARVSTKEQNLDRQLDQLAKRGVDKIFSDKISGVKESRPELDKMLGQLRSGDTVVVCSYDRLARSSKQLFSLAERFEENGVSLVSIKEGTDTSTPQGRFFFAMCAAMAQFERELIKERQAEGIPDKMDTAIRLYKDGGISVKEICERTGVSRAPLYRELKKKGIER